MYDLQHNLFGDFARSMRHVLDDLSEREQPRGAALTAAVDVVENASEVLLSVEAPGLRREDLHIEVDGRQLVIWGEKPEPLLSERETAVHRERRFGRFERSFTLGFGVDRDKISADYSLGVLTLRLPKAEPARARRIEVSAS